MPQTLTGINPVDKYEVESQFLEDLGSDIS